MSICLLPKNKSRNIFIYILYIYFLSNTAVLRISRKYCAKIFYGFYLMESGDPRVKDVWIGSERLQGSYGDVKRCKPYVRPRKVEIVNIGQGVSTPHQICKCLEGGRVYDR